MSIRRVALPFPGGSQVRLVSSLVCLALLAACGQKDQPAGPPSGALPVGVLTVQPTSAPVMVEAVGQAEGAREVEVRARVGGILVKRAYEEGGSVRAGQSLFELDRAPLEAALASARAQVSDATNKLEQATRELARTRGLSSQDAVSRKELDDAVTTEATARAQLQAAQASLKTAELNLGYAAVPAPVAGMTGRALKSEGNLVAVGDSLTTVVQVDPIKVRFALSESDEAGFPGGRFVPKAVQGVRIVLPNGSAYADKGTLDFAATQIDTKLGTRSLRAVFPNPEAAVLPGQYVRVRLQVGTREGVFRVPQSSLIQTDQGFVVMTVGEGDKVAPRPVKTGNWDGKDWIILDGLKAGDQVIVDNLIKLRPGMPVKPMPPGAMPPAGGASKKQG
ncbi:efflux RND transporter periplasmic adaptor subunit [Niveibacterium umoris]|uniref:Membrane fusion protein (Multidrug efflux system) n=1 Tax=Niveibacterium umoris TaxID=1193620 RepID=A0A840BNA8_9RHOO|nr:efflux RND transporter periplasmic adaptor subunit [Niveibacterium umoris]MBB4011957.1 membrane fusion protein (multidrug efflux system) [Niveibacterium umoris]